MNYERLKRIDDLTKEYVYKKYIAGAVTLVVKDGQVIQHNAYGYDDPETKTPSVKTLFFASPSNTI
jgi:hypothetical protein